MLQLRFFAGIRERMGVAVMQQPFEAAQTSVEALVHTLDSGAVPGCARWLLADNTIVAVNRVVASRSQLLHDGDEIAFYPPVTGG